MKFPHKQYTIIIFVLPVLLYGTYSFAASNFDLANLRNQSPIFTTAYDIIKVQDAWEKISATTPQSALSPIKIGVIDTGIDAVHNEFAGEQPSGSAVIGKINLGNTTPDTRTDTVGHGTAVSGIIGANNLSGEGFAINPGSPQMNGVLSGVLSPSKYVLEVSKTSSASTFLFDNLTDLFTQAKLQGSDVVNMSFDNVKRSALTAQQQGFVGGQANVFNFSLATQIYKFLFFRFHDTLFVVSAGNENIDAMNETPANLGGELSNVITVGGTTVGLGNIVDKRWVTAIEGSNFGTTTVNISAPGEAVYVPAPGNKYNSLFSGTSASAPLVTGTAGLIKSIKPTLTPAQIKQILIRTADTISTDKPIGGRLNAFTAVCAIELGLDCSSPAPFQILSGGDIILGDGTNSNGDLLTNNFGFFGKNLFHRGNIKADKLLFGDGGRVEGNIFYNSLITPPTTVLGTRSTPLSLPVVPQFTLPVVPIGTENVRIPAGTVRTLEPGNYHDIILDENATLILKDGVYDARLILLFNEASLRFSRNTLLNVNSDGTDSFFFVLPRARITSLDGISLLSLKIGNNESFVSFMSDEDTRIEANIHSENFVFLGDRVQYSGSIAAGLVVTAGNNFEWNVPRVLAPIAARKTQAVSLSPIESVSAFKTNTLLRLRQGGVSQDDYSRAERMFDEVIRRVE